MNENTRSLSAWASLGHGIYYLVTGVWPLFSISSFQRVTGQKIDLRLVKTVGALITVIGTVLVLAGVRNRTTPEIMTLAAGSASAFLAVDTVNVARRRISPIYLADAGAELSLILLWALIRFGQIGAQD